MKLTIASSSLLVTTLLASKASKSCAFNIAQPSAFGVARRAATQYSSKNKLSMVSSIGLGDSFETFDKPKEEDTWFNPDTEIQKYIKTPEPVVGRDNIDGTCLVSGLVKTADRTDQTIFDMLNNEESTFNFNKIIAYVNDEKFAKKRLLSRSARYTGLLDKLDFIEATKENALPTVEQLDGVKSWVAYVDDDSSPLDVCKEILDISKQVKSLENIAILMVGAIDLDVDETSAVLDMFKGTDKKFSIMTVGKITETEEGKVPYQLTELGTGNENATITSSDTFSRDESLRLITEALQLESGINKAYGVKEITDVNSTEVKLIKGLRGAGYTRSQEIDYMIRDGAANYAAAIKEFYEGNPNATRYSGPLWWEAPEYAEASREADEILQRKIDNEKSEKQIQIEELANEWCRREYYRLTMSNALPDKEMTEDEFTKSVWDDALVQGEIKWKSKMNLITDDEEADELSKFKKQQEKKKQLIMEKAKKELNDLLGNDDNDSDSDDDDSDDE